MCDKKVKPIKRGDIYFANLNPVVGSEQGNIRPVLIVSNDIGNKFSPAIVVVPLTCKLNKKPLPTHVFIPQDGGIEVDSLALVEQIRTIDRSRLDGYIGCIGSQIQLKVDDALAICVGIDGFQLDKGQVLTLCLCPRCERDFKESGCLLIKKGWQETKSTCDFCEVRLGLVFGVFGKEGAIDGII